jgi:arginyl-tRNA--protein-N-Asp/Glu arginylyltransferase
MPRYTYDELIEAYFRSIKKSFGRFSTAACREYVRTYRRKFDPEKFLQRVAQFLAEVDDQLSDYSLSSDGTCE